MTTPADFGSRAVRAATAAEKELKVFTVKQLRKKAKRLGMPGDVDKMSKQELINNLIDACYI